MGDIGLRGVEGKGLKGGSGSHRMWAWGPPTCTPPPLSPWGRQEAAHPRVSGWGKGTGCGYGWGEGSGSHIFPTFLQASQWVSLWIKRNRLGVGGWEEMDRKHPDYSPEGHGLLLWVPHSGAGPHRLEGDSPSQGPEEDWHGGGDSREGDGLPSFPSGRVPLGLENYYPFPGPFTH